MPFAAWIELRWPAHGPRCRTFPHPRAPGSPCKGFINESVARLEVCP